MFLRDLNQSPGAKIQQLNQLLREHFGTSVRPKVPTRQTLVSMFENANSSVIRIRNTGRKFHLDPEYAKFLGIRDVVDTMLKEGMYIESPAYHQMQEFLKTTARGLVDKGYTQDEASCETMKQYRLSGQWAYEDDFVQPLVDQYLDEYQQECSGGQDSTDVEIEPTADANLSPDIDGVDSESMPEFPGDFDLAPLSSFTATAVSTPNTDFSTNQELPMNTRGPGRLEDTIHEAVQRAKDIDSLMRIKKKAMRAFESMKRKGTANATRWRMVIEAFRRREQQLLENTVSLRGFATRYTRLNEQSEVDQAEVIMAVRALADDIQGQIERLGRMMNEDLPAIADQLRSENGAQTASSFSEKLNGALSSHLEATKQLKSQFDSAIATVTGDSTAELDAGDASGIDNEMDGDMGSDDFADSEIGGEGESNDTAAPRSKASRKATPPLGRDEI